jgi:sigma-B regulation protein RsbU (phosphoserine phosphatase)
MTSVSLETANFKLIALTPEADALGALSTLFNRSILFLFFSTFALIIISMIIARQMTAQLFLLTKAALQIGQGHFEAIPQIKSQDEMGVLSSAFNKMSGEILRLLNETRDKARMEAELKTAHLVQESLLPSQPDFKLNQIEINGLVVTSTECGGDWWHYFVKGNEIYVAIADATGHGTPAALITAAARSIFSRLENEDLSLAAMMRAWDNAISTCSKNKIFMTGILLQINTENGFCSFIGAGHESPFIITPQLDQYQFSFLDLDMHNSLGEGFDSDLMPQHYILPLNASLVLYTDGLFAVENGQGKKISEKRFGKKMAQLAPQANSATEVTKQILKEFNDHREHSALPDDVSVVVIRRVHSQSLKRYADSADIV